MIHGGPHFIASLDAQGLWPSDTRGPVHCPGSVVDGGLGSSAMYAVRCAGGRSGALAAVVIGRGTKRGGVPKFKKNEHKIEALSSGKMYKQ